MTGILEQDDVAGARLAQVGAKQSDDVPAGRVAVLQDFQIELLGIKSVGQSVGEVIDVVEASPELADRRRIVIDSSE